jgi:molybdopterin synthase catalytic subunit
MIRVNVQREDFSIEDEVSLVRRGRTEIGAIVTFSGLVRDLNEGDSINLLSLEHYPGMTEKQLEQIAREAEQRWQLQAITIIHRIGHLNPGDQIVLVVTASHHRQAAFAANEYIMDFLKTRATFWKKELLESGSRWLESRDSDTAAAERWKK